MEVVVDGDTGLELAAEGVDFVANESYGVRASCSWSGSFLF